MPRPPISISLVSIDNDSIRRMEPLVGRWPWPRLVHATVIDYLAAAGAKVIAYDVLFPERDIRKFMVADTEWTGEESDAALVESTEGRQRRARRRSGECRARRSVAGDRRRSHRAGTQREAAVGRLRATAAAADAAVSGARASVARGIGHTLFILDSDGPVRRVAPVVQVGERTIPVVLAGGDHGGGRDAGARARVDDSGQCAALVPWRGPAENRDGQPTFTSYSFYDLFHSQQQIIEGQKPGIDPSLFKDRIVIVGVNAEGLHEVFTTPFPEGEINGPEVHANMVDALLANRSIVAIARLGHRRPDIAPPAIVGVAGVVPQRVADRRGGARRRGDPASGSRSLCSRAASGSRSRSRCWRIVFAFVGDLAWKYFVEGREKRQVKKLFSRYVSKDVYDQLVANPSLAALGGARRHMTVLFSDMRGFTAMSEKGTPEEVVGQLNELFTRMVRWCSSIAARSTSSSATW